MNCVICGKAQSKTAKYQGCNRCIDRLITERGNEIMQGSGVLDDLQRAFERVRKVAKNVILGPSELSPSIKQFLVDHPANISKVTIDRAPIRSAITTLANIGSLGKFNKLLKSTPYDKLFHLRLNSSITLSDGFQCYLEKNVIITLKQKKFGEPKGGHDLLPVDSFPSITIGELLDKTEKLMGKDKFYRYSAKHSNCQDFVLNCLHSVDIVNETYDSFIKQEVKVVFQANPYYRQISNFFTGIAARRHVIAQGGNAE
jgi:hypothetical protein